jgi:hypothetical protein
MDVFLVEQLLPKEVIIPVLFYFARASSLRLRSAGAGLTGPGPVGPSCFCSRTAYPPSAGRSPTLNDR